MSDSASNATVPAVSPLLITTELGPIFVGNVLNWLLMGVLTVQFVRIAAISYSRQHSQPTDAYSNNFPRDRLLVKILVYTLFVVDIVQTGLGTHEAWWFLIEHWGDVSSLQRGPWSALTIPITCGLVSAPVQLFYAYRIWRLRYGPVARLVCAVMVLSGLAQSMAGITGSALLQSNVTQENLIRLHPVFTFWLAGSFITDFIVAVTMTWILHTAKSASAVTQTNGMLNRLMINTIQTGTATGLCAGLELVMFLRFPQTNYHWAFAYILGKLYTNSFMVSINLREPRRRSKLDAAESIELRIQVSRDVERTMGGNVKMRSQADNWTTEDSASTDARPKAESV
ncbi:hypothetical protein C8R46DRAFT_1361185 [Mycena filopes]|nr:hypothetical protein C8R46DRAFT_1361185 [Mycena filopes]